MEPIFVAFIRGIIGAVLVGGLTLLTTYQVTGVWSDSLLSGGIAALGILITRFGIEGTIDQTSMYQRASDKSRY